MQAQANISQEMITASLIIGLKERNYLGVPSSGFSEGLRTPWVEFTLDK